MFARIDIFVLDQLAGEGSLGLTTMIHFPALFQKQSFCWFLVRTSGTCTYLGSFFYSEAPSIIGDRINYAIISLSLIFMIY